MVFLPIAFNIEDKTVLIVGGGRVALHKIKTLLAYSPRVRVCAPKIINEIQSLPVECVVCTYRATLLTPDVGLVYACTNAKSVNQNVRNDCRVYRMPVNVADSPADSDFISPAIFKQGNMSVAVTSNGQNVRQSLTWRDKIKAWLS